MLVGEFVRAGVDLALHLDAVIDVNIHEVPRTEKRELLGIKHGTDRHRRGRRYRVPGKAPGQSWLE